MRVAAPYRTAHPTMLLSMLGVVLDDVPPQILSLERAVSHARIIQEKDTY